MRFGFDAKALTLVLDAANSRVFAGLILDGQWIATRSLGGHTHESLFRAVRECLDDMQLRLEDVGAFIYGRGPGSTLGLRIAGLAIGAWRALPQWKQAPLAGYSSLVYLGLTVARKAQVHFPFSVVSEARMGSWFHLRMTSPTTWEPIERLDGTGSMDFSQLYYWPQAKPWGATSLVQLPENRKLSYELGGLAEVLGTPGFLEALDCATPLELAQPEYKIWEGKRHGG